MKPYQRVALRYARQNQIRFVSVRSTTGSHRIEVMNKDDVVIGYIEGEFGLHFFDEVYEFECSEDIIELYDLWEDSVSPKPDGAWDLQVPVLEVLESELNEEYRSQGLGLKMYKELANQVREEVGYPIFFIPNYCNKRSTSTVARRVWKSLSKSNPQSSDDVILMIERNLR